MVRRKEGGAGSKRLHEAFRLVQERYVLFIVDALARGPKGFNELSRESFCASGTTLAARLSELEAEGILEKSVLSAMPPRTEYQLTARGRGLEKVVRALADWAEDVA